MTDSSEIGRMNTSKLESFKKIKYRNPQGSPIAQEVFEHPVGMPLGNALLNTSDERQTRLGNNDSFLQKPTTRKPIPTPKKKEKKKPYMYKLNTGPSIPSRPPPPLPPTHA